MKTCFPKLRCLLKWPTILLPVLGFTCFLCLARGWHGWALVPIGLFSFLAFMFPFPLVTPLPARPPSGFVAKWGNILPGLLLFAWLLSLPGALEFLQRATEPRRLWDWRLILAVLLWHGRWGYLFYQKVAALKDAEILAYYDAEPAPTTSETAPDGHAR